jgi:hypothetical protein
VPTCHYRRLVRLILDFKNKYIRYLIPIVQALVSLKLDGAVNNFGRYYYYLNLEELDIPAVRALGVRSRKLSNIGRSSDW